MSRGHDIDDRAPDVMGVAIIAGVVPCTATVGSLAARAASGRLR
jgi:hypothetical protein